SVLVNLINEEITHKVFGEGNIVDHDDSIITVDFNEDIKKFVYPDAFGNFITLNDRDTAKSLKNILLKRTMEEEAQERKRDEEEQQSVFTDWQVFTGKVQSGKNKGQPNRAARVSPNSAGLLTARESDQPETERRILGLYMVNETFSGNLNDDGMVPAHAEFRSELTDQEAEKMLFWNYYINNNYPDRTTWNSGKYRYFDNVWTAQILKDIIALKTDEEQIKEAKNFLEYFCQMNVLDIDNIPEANGALKQ